jgi:hypothetical protein
LLRRLGLDAERVAAEPQIAPLLKQCGILPARVIEVLRADQSDESKAIVARWDELTPASRNLLGLEPLAMSAGMTPRRLWEMYCGASMMQTRECIGLMIANALPSVMQKTIQEAKKAKGHMAREHIFKSARVLPTPKGSVINIGTLQKELPEGDEPEEEGGMLEQADDFMLKASKVMHAKALPAPAVTPEILEPETEEDGGEE